MQPRSAMLSCLSLILYFKEEEKEEETKKVTRKQWIRGRRGDGTI
jgi:hypothetical protein